MEWTRVRDRLARILPVGFVYVSSCCGVFSPALEVECPDTARVGEEITIRIRNIDDYAAVTWSSQDAGEGAFVAGDADHASTGASGGGASPNPTEIIFRADVAGTVTIRVEEEIVGAPICIPPLPEQSTLTCAITIEEPA